MTPPKSELDAARERLEAILAKREEALRFIDKQSGWMSASEPTQRAREYAADLRLVLDALKEAERAVKDQEPIVSAVVDWSHTGVRGFEWNAVNAFLADITIKANELVTKWTSTPIDTQEQQ